MIPRQKLLSRKIILAHILKNTIEEFVDLEPEEIASLIEGEVLIDKVPLDPGYTNQKDPMTGKITGFNTEDSEVNEGLVRYDIIFYVRMADGLSQIIVNIEPMKDDPSKYHILNRAVYYACRMISSQKGRDFHKMDYNLTRKVYSIWICMNTKEAVLDHIHLENDSIIGNMEWKGDLDLLNIIMVGLPDELPPRKKEYAIHRLLGALFSLELSAEQKIEVMEKEYKIPVSNELKEEVKIMNAFSQIAEEKGWKEGNKRGREEEVYSSVRDGDYSIQRGMEKLNMTDEELFRKNAAELGYTILQ